MADDRTDPLADLFTLFATPLSGAVRSIDQFRKGVDEFLKGVENFNKTMENLNETSQRINVLLAEVEEPIRAAIPQVTRTVKAADQVMQVVSGPAIAVAPGLAAAGRHAEHPGVRAAARSDGAVHRTARRHVPAPRPLTHAGGVGGRAVRRVPGAGHAIARPAAVRPLPASTQSPARTLGQASQSSSEAPAKKRAAPKADAGQEAGAHRRRRRRRTADARRRCRSVVDERRRRHVAQAVPCRGRRRRRVAPSAVSGGRNASAMPWPSTGEKLPLVTSPTACPSTSTVHPARAGRRPSVAMPNRRRRDAGVRSASAASRPTNVRFVPRHDPAEPGLQRRDARSEFVAVQWERRLEAQRVASAESGRRDSRRRTTPARDRRQRPTGSRSRGRSRRCSPVPAMVHGTPWKSATVTRNRPMSAGGGEHRRHERLRVGTLHGDHRTIRRRVDAADRRADARGVGRVRHDVEGRRCARSPPDDDVVDHRCVVVVEEMRVLGAPWLDLGEVVGERRLQTVEGVRRRRPEPCRDATRRTSTPWRRHARCSSIVPDG